VTLVAIDPHGADRVSARHQSDRFRSGARRQCHWLYELRSSAKWLDLLKEIAPGVKRAAVLRKIAAYFAAKSWPAQTAATATLSPPNGIAQCQPCHQPNFEGGPPAPRLAGLSYEYLVAMARYLSAL
jgi:mono/diheme cytochrome c family protein